MKLNKEGLQHITNRAIEDNIATETEQVEYELNLAAQSGKYSAEFQHLSQAIVEKLRDNGFSTTYSHVGHNEYAWTISWK